MCDSPKALEKEWCHHSWACESLTRLCCLLGWGYGGITCCPAVLRLAMWMLWLLSLFFIAVPASAEFGFDEKYERDYDNCNPIN